MKTLFNKTINFNWYNIIEKFLLCIMLSYILCVIINLILYLYFGQNVIIYMSSTTPTGSNVPDPVRFWPSGTTQSWGILAGALAMYKAFPGSSRGKAIAGLSTLGVTIPSAIWFHAVENPNGFERVIHCLADFKKTGTLANPIDIGTVNSDELAKNINAEHLKEVKELENVVSSSSSTGSSLVSSLNSNSDFENILTNTLARLNDSVWNNLLSFFRPVEVSGHLDSLLGVQYIIYLAIFIISVSVSLLLVLHFLTTIFVLNKDRIIKKFSNKLVVFYIKYQSVLGTISIYILPGLMLFGLLNIALASYHLITHPIPYESLNIDLHQIVDSKTNK